MKTIIFLFSMIGFSLSVTAQNKDEQSIRQLMNKQVEAWNRGNIDAFMNGYWKNDSLLFVGKNGAEFGWTTALENYKKHYADTAAMGKLHFDILQIKQLSTEYYFVLGKWHLTRSVGNIGGYYTLLFKKINGVWLIMADHTS
ncbi:MAG: YybH family protein [Chitinophagaceae bacterium]